MTSTTTRTALTAALAMPLVLGAVVPASADELSDPQAAPAAATAEVTTAPADAAAETATAPAESTPAPTQTTPRPTAVTTTAKKVSASGTARGATRKIPPSRGRSPHKYGTVTYSKWYARNYMDYKYNWGSKHYKSLEKLWTRESGWNQHAHNGSSGAHGIPQALPGGKMASHGPNWRSNPETQIKWGLSYIKGRYHTPTGAWKAFQHKGWY